MALKKLVTNSFDDDSVTSAKLANALVSDINTGVNFSVPAGGIIMWSGATNAIPTGWVLCDGQNGTPDLRDKFVIGASDSSGDTSYPGLSPNATGGSADAVVVEHTHGITEPNGGQGHNHSMEYTNTGNNDGRSEESGDGGVSGSHDTSFATTGITINSQGVSGTNQNLPPYMALAYIMKTA